MVDAVVLSTTRAFAIVTMSGRASFIAGGVVFSTDNSLAARSV